jgi:hypothetical protein
MAATDVLVHVAVPFVDDEHEEGEEEEQEDDPADEEANRRADNSCAAAARIDDVLSTSVSAQTKERKRNKNARNMTVNKYVIKPFSTYSTMAVFTIIKLYFFAKATVDSTIPIFRVREK